jgi:hypothetical protein
VTATAKVPLPVTWLETLNSRNWPAVTPVTDARAAPSAGWLFQVSVDSLQVEGTARAVKVADDDADTHSRSTAETSVEPAGMPVTVNFT